MSARQRAYDFCREYNESYIDADAGIKYDVEVLEHGIRAAAILDVDGIVYIRKGIGRSAEDAMEDATLGVMRAMSRGKDPEMKRVLNRIQVEEHNRTIDDLLPPESAMFELNKKAEKLGTRVKYKCRRINGEYRATAQINISDILMRSDAIRAESKTKARRMAAQDLCYKLDIRLDL